MGSTPTNPLGAVLSGGVSLLGDIIGTIVGYNDEKEKEKEAKREWGEEVRREDEKNRFSEGAITKQLGMKGQELGIEKGRFGIEKIQAAGGISKDMLQSVADLANKHAALGNNVVKLWGV